MTDTPIEETAPDATPVSEAPVSEAPAETVPDVEAVPEVEAAAEVEPPTEAPAESVEAAAGDDVVPPAPKPATARAPRAKRPKPLIQATGRRKEAVARLRVRPGSGAITVNRKTIEIYFPSETHRMIITEPLRITTMAEVYDIDASIDGGGMSGQAGALRLGIARALAALDGELRAPLKKAGLLSRDDREKESKKYGLKKARKAPQYSKR